MTVVILTTAELETLQTQIDEQRARIAELEQPGCPLTRRELRVLVMIAQGYGYRQIADRLHVSERTVRHHSFNLLTKLGLTSRLEAALYAWRNGIVDPLEAWASVETMQYRTLAKGR